MKTPKSHTPPSPLSRRGYLKLFGPALLGPAFGFPLSEVDPHPTARLGRALLSYVTVYARPSVYAPAVRRVPFDGTIPLFEEINGEDTEAPRNRWFRTDDGYVATNNVQPVGFRLNRPLAEVPPAGQLLEVSVPFVDAYPRPSAQGPVRYRLYFSTTHWADQVLAGDDRRPWYRLYDDRINEWYFVRAESQRPVHPREMVPLSPHVPDDRKRIELDTTGQWLAAYEGERLVLRARIASGKRFVRSNDEVGDFRTPLGEFRVGRKRASRHMAAGDGVADDSYDLPGVPWVSYFNGGIAFHGTYWHNDFGFAKSHGCINLSSEVAKWVFRWTLPRPVPGERLTEGRGTRVIVR